MRTPSFEGISYFEYIVYARPLSFQIQNVGCVIRVYYLMNNICVTSIRYVLKSELFESMPRKRPGMEIIIRRIFSFLFIDRELTT